jgi:uncharacterized protein YukE
MSTPGKIQVPFQAMETLNGQINNTASSVDTEMQRWMTTSHITSQSWLDNAGGAFGEVSAAAKQVSVATDNMLVALASGVVKTNTSAQEAVMRGARSFGH